MRNLALAEEKRWQQMWRYLGVLWWSWLSRANHLPKPAETFMGSLVVIDPGGKRASQAVAEHRAGADVTTIPKWEKTFFGNVVLDFYMKEGVVRNLVIPDNTKETGIALIMANETTRQEICAYRRQ